MNIRFQYNTKFNSCESSSEQELTQHQKQSLTCIEETVSDYAKVFCSEEHEQYFVGDVNDVKAFAIAELHNHFGSEVNIEFVVN